MGSIWRRMLRGDSLDYSNSPYSNPRRPHEKPYSEMSKLEQRIDRKIKLASTLALFAGAVFGIILILIFRMTS